MGHLTYALAWPKVTLDDSDLRSVLDVAAFLASDPVPSVNAVLDQLRSLIPCASASFNDMTLASGDFRYVIVPPEEEELAARLKPVFDRLADQHPLIAAARRQPVSGALRFCDIVGGEQFTETEFYREFFEPFGLRYQIVIQLPSPPDIIVGHALNRVAPDGEFSDRDVAVLNALGPHLAMHHRHTVDRERERARSSEADFGGGWVVMTVRSDGVVEDSSDRSPSAPFGPGHRLPASIVELLPSYGDAEIEPHVHEVEVGDQRWRCAVHPVLVGPTVLLVRRAGDEPDEMAPLIDLGFTPRQTEVAFALAHSGGTNAQLARTLEISEGTVKKHLETVFRVLMVDSRAAAVAALRSIAD